MEFDQRTRAVSPGRAQPAGGLAVVALRRRDVSRGAVGRRVDQVVAVAGPSTQNVAKLSKRCQLRNVLYCKCLNFSILENLAHHRLKFAQWRFGRRVGWLRLRRVMLFGNCWLSHRGLWEEKQRTASPAAAPRTKALGRAATECGAKKPAAPERRNSTPGPRWHLSA